MCLHAVRRAVHLLQSPFCNEREGRVVEGGGDRGRGLSWANPYKINSIRIPGGPVNGLFRPLKTNTHRNPLDSCTITQSTIHVLISHHRAAVELANYVTRACATSAPAPAPPPPADTDTTSLSTAHVHIEYDIPQRKMSSQISNSQSLEASTEEEPAPLLPGPAYTIHLSKVCRIRRIK